jgi:hypothetical protein
MLFHMMFWKIFDWKHELVKMQPINQGIMQVFNGVIIFLLFYMTVSTWNLGKRKESDRGEKALLGLYAGFFLVRAVLEVPFFGFSGRGVGIMLVCLGLAGGYFWNAFSRTGGAQ